jgi:PAS domain S-box-containing protein
VAVRTVGSKPAGERWPADVTGALVRARRLQLLTEALAETRDPQQVLDAVIGTGLGLDAAGAKRGLIALVDERGEELEIAAWYGYREQTMRSWRRFALTDDFPLSRAVMRGEPVFIRSQSERDRLFPALRGRSDEGHALACLPLIVEGRTLGGLALSFAEDEDFDDDRRAFKIALARQVAQALERTRLFEAERTLRERMSFLAGVGELLSSSLDYEQTLARLAESIVPRLADWCTVDMLSEDGRELQRLALAHTDPEMVAYANELGSRYPPKLDSPYGVGKVIRSQEPDFIPEISDELLVAGSEGDEELLGILRALKLRSAITVPLVARGRSLGAVTLIRSDSDRAFTQTDLELAVELARRAATAVDNSLLFRETQRLADAARSLEHVAEAVVLLDHGGLVRHWNQGAERLTGLSARAVVGRPATEAVPGWSEIGARVTAVVDGAAPVALTLPLPSPRGERWCAVVGVSFEHGHVYTLRDVTAEHDLERMRSDFVATASHELRTPLSAIYGAIRTIRRDDVEIPAREREQFLEMIETEAERLRAIIAQLLVAGSLDADSLSISVRPVELDPLVRDVVAAAELGAPDAIRFDSRAPRTPIVALADRELLRQVLANVVDNAVKYSPEGGTVRLTLTRFRGRARIAVADEGIGIPPEAQARIFEKFFRADPGLTRGIGGSGLGLYIADALTRRMDGEIRLASTAGKGSTFTVELPLAPQRR